MKKTFLFLLGAVALATLGFTSCGDDDDDIDNTPVVRTYVGQSTLTISSPGSDRTWDPYPSSSDAIQYVITQNQDGSIDLFQSSTFFPHAFMGMSDMNVGQWTIKGITKTGNNTWKKDISNDSILVSVSNGSSINGQYAVQAVSDTIPATVAVTMTNEGFTANLQYRYGRMPVMISQTIDARLDQQKAN